MTKKTGAWAEEQLAFYSEELCPLSETLYQFAFGMTASAQLALNFVEQTYRAIASDFDQVLSGSDPKISVFLIALRSKESLQPVKGIAVGSELQALLLSMEQNARICLLLADFVGFPAEDIVKILGVDEYQIRKWLAQARQKLVE